MLTLRKFSPLSSFCSFRLPFRALPLLTFLAVTPAYLSFSHEAKASIAIAMPYDTTVEKSDLIALVEVIENHSTWEEGKIVTYSHVKVIEQVAGKTEDVWIRSLGGEVGDIAQLTGGEPTFVVGEQCLVFLKHLPASSSFVLVGRAQGQYFLEAPKDTQNGKANLAAMILKSHPDPGVLVPPSKVPEPAMAIVPKAFASDLPSSIKTRLRTNTFRAAETKTDELEILKTKLAGLSSVQDKLIGKTFSQVKTSLQLAWKKAHPSSELR